MPLLSIIRSFSFRRNRSLSTSTTTTSSQATQQEEARAETSREERASIIRKCLSQSILLPPPATGDTHRRAHRRAGRGHRISFDDKTEAHQHFKSQGFPRVPTFSIEDDSTSFKRGPAHWSRGYHIMYEGGEGPIIQDAMYACLMQVLLPEATQTPLSAPERPMLPSVESFATIKHQRMNDDMSLENFTPSPPSTPRASPRTSAPQVVATPRRKPVFLSQPLSESPVQLPSTPVRAPSRRGTKRLPDSASMQAVFGLNISVSTSFDTTADFALGLLVASESKDSKGTWDSIPDLSNTMAERRRTQTAGF